MWPTVRHARLGEIVGWKQNNVPGIRTRAGLLTAWPRSLGAVPTNDDLLRWIAEWEALPTDSEAKNPIAYLRAQAMAATSLDELRAVVLGMIR